MHNLNEMIKKADAGDINAQMAVAQHIIWRQKGTISPDMAQRAVRYYENAAKHGNENAMIDLGTMYRQGRGVTRDMDKCFYWTKQATALLNPMAYQYLGYHYEIPVGYSDINDENADYKAVFDCFFKGAVLDDSICMYKIGDMYFSGKFVEKDQWFAFLLYKRSDELSDYASASLNLRLAECYCMGLGTEQDIDKARERLEDAVSEYKARTEDTEDPMYFMEGFNRAKNLLKRIEADKIPGRPINLAMKKKDAEYATFVTSEQMEFPEPEYPATEIEILKAENPVISYLPGNVSFCDLLTKAQADDGYAMYHLAIYLHQRFEKANASVVNYAIHCFYKAARNGYSPAMYYLGNIYRKGEGVNADPYKALLLFEHSNQVIAGEEIGKYYLNGDIVPQNYEIAYKYFAKCVLLKEKYDYAAISELARMYREGLYIEADKKFADYLDEQSKKRCESAENTYDEGR